MDLTRVYTADDFTLTGLDTDTVAQRLVSMPVTRTMLGTSTLTLVLADRIDGRTYELLRGPRALELWDDKGLVRGDVGLVVHDPQGDLPFVLREVEKTDTGLQLVFYDGLLSALLSEQGPETAYRDSQTRAAFVASLCRKAGVPVFVPEKRVEQPIKDFSKDDRKTIKSADRVKRKDRSQPSEPLPRDRESTDVVESGPVTLQSWARSLLQNLGAPITIRNVKAVVGWELAEGGHWHNTARYNPLNTTQNMPGSGDTGTQGNISIYASWEQGMEATLKTIRDGWSQHGYGKIVSRLKDGASLSSIAQAISDSAWMPGAYPNLLAAMQGASPDGGGRTITAVPGTSESFDVAVIERYEFRVGRDENYLHAARRLADEVRFRFFSTLDQAIYASDVALANQPISMQLREGTGGVDRILWVATRRRRIDKMRVTARTIPWAAPPGSSVDVLGERPAAKLRDDGSEWPWLVREMTRDLMDPKGEASIMLGQPQRPRKEPAPEVTSRTVDGTEYPTGGGSGTPGEASGNWIWPTNPHPLSSDFGPRTAPTAGASTYHDGIDIAMPSGTPVKAVDGGKVTRAGVNGGYGNYVEISHGNGLITFYAHLSAIRCSAGQSVRQGQIIGLVGTTGTSTGDHLHFGTHLNGAPVDPMRYLP